MLLLNDFSNAFKVSHKEDMSCEGAAKRCTVEDIAPFQQVLMGLRLSSSSLTKHHVMSEVMWQESKHIFSFLLFTKHQTHLNFSHELLGASAIRRAKLDGIQ